MRLSPSIEMFPDILIFIFLVRMNSYVFSRLIFYKSISLVIFIFVVFYILTYKNCLYILNKNSLLVE